MEVSLIANTAKRKKCRCKPTCAMLVRFVDIDGDVLKTLCANDARQLAFTIISGLIDSNVSTQKTLRSQQRWENDGVETLVNLYKQGDSYGMIAIKVGRTYRSVARKLQRMIKEKKLVPRN